MGRGVQILQGVRVARGVGQGVAVPSEPFNLAASTRGLLESSPNPTSRVAASPIIVTIIIFRDVPLSANPSTFYILGEWDMPLLRLGSVQ